MISKNCFSFFLFFLRRHLQKVLYPSVILFACFFDCKYYLHFPLFSLIVMAFPACTCEQVLIQHSFEFLCVVSGIKCVGLAQKISARCNTGFYVFSFSFICIFILLLALSHMYVFFHSLSAFPQIWK